MVNGGHPDVEARLRSAGTAGVPPLQEVLVLGAEADGVGALVSALTRLGAGVRLLDLADPSLRARLLGSRPDLVIPFAVTPPAGRAVQGALEPAIDGLRALAVPVIAAIGAAAPSGDLITLVDDILLPPHDAAEALLRATVVVRRRGLAGASLVSAGPLTVDVEGFRAWLAGAPITLTYTEFQLLRLLLLNRGKVLTRQVLLNKIWGYDYLGGLRTVDVHIRRLRAKIEGEAPYLIETVRHVGYRIGEEAVGSRPA